MTNAETWKHVPGYEGLYSVSDLGRVFSFERNGTPGGILKPDITRYGYYKVKLYKNNKPKVYGIHQLVMLAFIGPTELCVNHLNMNKGDNRLVNLEYVTHKQNVAHALAMGGGWQRHGENHPNAKLTSNEVRAIKIIHTGGLMSQRIIAELFKVSESQISRIVNNKERCTG